MTSEKRKREYDVHCTEAMRGSSPKKLCSQRLLDDPSKRRITDETVKALESQRGWDLCTKNPGHTQFVPIQEFKNEHIPKISSHTGQNLLRAFCDLTVRLRVNSTSSERNLKKDVEACGQNDDVFNGGNGTGCVEHVRRNFPYYSCPCRECEDGSMKAENECSYSFIVRTAKHVVFNSEEAAETRVDFFYDSEKSDRDGTMKSVWGVKVIDSSGDDRDWVNFLCITHDEELGQRINSARIATFYNEPVYPDLHDLGLLDLASDAEPILIIQHPHGMRKHAAMGVRSCGDGDFPKIKYTTPTCRGSSGARVIRYGLNNKNKFKHQYQYLAPVHRGTEDKTCNKNYGFWWWWREVKKTVSQICKGRPFG